MNVWVDVWVNLPIGLNIPDSLPAHTMRGTLDKTSTKILILLQESEEPLETKEIETLLAETKLKDVTRI